MVNPGTILSVISRFFLPTLAAQMDATFAQTVSVLFGSEDGAR